jgi:hypothetical protein
VFDDFRWKTVVSEARTVIAFCHDEQLGSRSRPVKLTMPSGSSAKGFLIRESSASDRFV